MLSLSFIKVTVKRWSTGGSLGVAKWDGGYQQQGWCSITAAGSWTSTLQPSTSKAIPDRRDLTHSRTNQDWNIRPCKTLSLVEANYSLAGLQPVQFVRQQESSGHRV